MGQVVTKWDGPAVFSFAFAVMLAIQACGHTELGDRLAIPNGVGTSSSGLGFSYLGAAVATGDFNGDGHVDIALAQDSAGNRTGTLYLFINQGDGSFADPASYSLTAVPCALVSADWNRDGLADLAVSLASSTQL